MRKETEGGFGSINIRIQIENDKNLTIFDKRKNLKVLKNSSNISLAFNWIKPGDYKIIIEAKDLFNESIKIELLIT